MNFAKFLRTPFYRTSLVAASCSCRLLNCGLLKEDYNTDILVILWSNFFSTWFIKQLQFNDSVSTYISLVLVGTKTFIRSLNIFHQKTAKNQKHPFTDVIRNRCLKNVIKFTGKHLCWSLFLIKLQAFRSANQAFSCEFCEILLATFDKTPPDNYFWRIFSQIIQISKSHDITATRYLLAKCNFYRLRLLRTKISLELFPYSDAVHRGNSVEKVFLKNLRNSLRNSCVTDSSTGVFLWICKIIKNIFLTVYFRVTTTAYYYLPGSNSHIFICLWFSNAPNSIH